MRVLIADDDRVCRHETARLLRESGVDVVAEVPADATALASAIELEPDIAIVALDDENAGLDLIRSLTAQLPDLHVLGLGGDDLEAAFVEARRLGAAGYLRRSQKERLGVMIRLAAALFAGPVAETETEPRRSGR